MKIDNIELVYFIDYLGRKVHLLEKSNSGTQDSLPNVLSPSFQRKLIEREHLLIDLMDFDWILYSQGRFVTRYRAYNLAIVSKTEKWLHKPFLDDIGGI